VRSWLLGGLSRQLESTLKTRLWALYQVKGEEDEDEDEDEDEEEEEEEGVSGVHNVQTHSLSLFLSPPTLCVCALSLSDRIQRTGMRARFCRHTRACTELTHTRTHTHTHTHIDRSESGSISVGVWRREVCASS
jgi:hypothetical protein